MKKKPLRSLKGITNDGKNVRHRKINTRFCRSININQDLGNADILAGFICPASSEIALLNIAENVYATGQAAFTWTGPYGSGKSSLALFYQH